MDILYEEISKKKRYLPFCVSSSNDMATKLSISLSTCTNGPYGKNDKLNLYVTRQNNADYAFIYNISKKRNFTIIKNHKFQNNVFTLKLVGGGSRRRSSATVGGGGNTPPVATAVGPTEK